MAYRADDENRTVDDDVTVRSGDATTDDPEVLRAEIGQTRARMSETLDELGERLNPQNIKEQVKDQIRDATIGTVQDVARTATERVRESGGTIMHMIRENPIPAAMVAIGLGWMLVSSRREGDGRDAARSGRSWANDDVRYAGEGYVGGTSSAYVGGMYREGTIAEGHREEESQGVVDRVKERAGDIGHRVAETAGNVKERVAETAGNVGERVRGVAHTTADRTRDIAHRAGETTRRQAVRVEHGYEENPLIFGAIALAVGIGAGMSIPVTRREREWIGETRDRVVDRVKEVAQDKGQKAQHVAERAFDAAKETARQAAHEEGLVKGA